MSDRPTQTGVLGQTAHCYGCGWTGEGRGTLGRAAQHYDRTGHEIHVETTTVVIYGGAPPDVTEEQGQLI